MTKEELDLIEKRANEIRAFNARQEEMRRELLAEYPTLRDQFAMSVLGSLTEIYCQKSLNLYQLVVDAYKIADEMLEARKTK